jgi:hypothetical protein
VVATADAEHATFQAYRDARNLACVRSPGRTFAVARRGKAVARIPIKRRPILMLMGDIQCAVTETTKV